MFPIYISFYLHEIEKTKNASCKESNNKCMGEKKLIGKKKLFWKLQQHDALYKSQMSSYNTSVLP